MKALFIYTYPDKQVLRNTEEVYLRFLREIPEIRTTYLNTSKFRSGSSALRNTERRLLSQDFQLVIYHYSFLGQRTWGPAFPQFRDDWSWLSGLKGHKVALPQDEGAYSSVLEEWLIDLEVDSVGSVHFERNRQTLYQRLKRTSHIFPTLPGYLPSKTPFRKQFVMPNQRKYTVGYWARDLPYWVGSHGLQKSAIARAALALDLPGRSEVVVSSKNYLAGLSWIELLGNSEITLGCEGGYSALDRYGEIRAFYEYFKIVMGAGGSFSDFDRSMPPGWDDFQLLTMTPRHLESAAVGTIMVLTEGQYSGILQPHVHYVPVKKDFSNLSESLAIAQDPHTAESLRRNAYRDLVSSGHYSTAALAQQVKALLN